MKEQIAAFAKAAPFAPFQIEMVGGRVLTVNHPEFIYVPPGRTATFIVTTSDGVAEHFNANLVLKVREIKGSRKQARRRKAG